MRKDLIGESFGRLTVISMANDIVSDSGYHTVMWNCKCSCGNTVTVRGKSLIGGVTKSCGCLQKELLSVRASKHHGFGTRLYAVWNSMRQRCNNPKHHAYHNYGGRGIRVCNEWDDYSKFRDWAIGTGYDEDAPRGVYTLDRINANGCYSPDNCRWADMRCQANNKRDTIRIEYNGDTKTLTEWAQLTGIDYTTIWKRYSAGMSPENILRKRTSKNQH